VRFGARARPGRDRVAGSEATSIGPLSPRPVAGVHVGEVRLNISAEDRSGPCGARARARRLLNPVRPARSLAVMSRRSCQVKRQEVTRRAASDFWVPTHTRRRTARRVGRRRATRRPPGEGRPEPAAPASSARSPTSKYGARRPRYRVFLSASVIHVLQHSPRAPSRPCRRRGRRRRGGRRLARSSVAERGRDVHRLGLVRVLGKRFQAATRAALAATGERRIPAVVGRIAPAPRAARHWSATRDERSTWRGYRQVTGRSAAGALASRRRHQRGRRSAILAHSVRRRCQRGRSASVVH